MKSSTTTRLSIEDPNFIPLVEAGKRKKMSLEEVKELKMPPAQIIEERWRAKPLVISEVMMELERLRVSGEEKESRGVVARRNVSACLKIAMSKFLLIILLSSILTLGRSFPQDIRILETIPVGALPLSCYSTVNHTSRMARCSWSWPRLWIQLAEYSNRHLGLDCWCSQEWYNGDGQVVKWYVDMLYCTFVIDDVMYRGNAAGPRH